MFSKTSCNQVHTLLKWLSPSDSKRIANSIQLVPPGGLSVEESPGGPFLPLVPMLSGACNTQGRDPGDVQCKVYCNAATLYLKAML